MLQSDINKSSTLSKDFYLRDDYWKSSKNSVFANQTLFLGTTESLFSPQNNCIPIWLLEHFLDESLIVISQDDQLRCVSNVCTHRGFTLLQSSGKHRKITCQYHGRQFNLEGKFLRMPEFNEAEDFPRPCDHLSTIPLSRWNNLIFAHLNLDKAAPPWIEVLNNKLGFLPWSEGIHYPEYDQSYSVKAHWALYVDNFLEGFHVPFVHDGLGAMLDYGSYSTDIFDRCVLQTGFSSEGTEHFNLPEDHKDYGKKITAYYFWMYPNFMINVYPWGYQLNVVEPKSKEHTRVMFNHYIWDIDCWERMKALDIAEKTEREDEMVVEAVQRGIKSRFYVDGRFSPTREQGVHYFHRLLQQDLNLTS